MLAVGAVLPVLPAYVKDVLGEGDLAVGVAVGCYAVSGLVLRPFAGRLADRWGRRPTAILGSLLLAVGGFFYLLPLGYAWVVFARLVVGAGEGTIYTAGSAWTVDLSAPERRGRTLGLYGLAVWGGLSIGPLLGAGVKDAMGYDAVWLLAAIFPVLGALVVAPVKDRFVPPDHDEPHPLVAPEALRPGIAVGLAAVGYATVAAFVVLLLDSRGVGDGALVFAAFAGAIVLSRILLGHLPDQIGPRRTAIGAALVEAVGIAAIGLAANLPMALAGGVAMGAGFSLLNPAMMVVVVERVGPAGRGAALGTYSAIFDLGVGVGAPIAGAAAAVASYEFAFILGALFAVASAVLIFVMIGGDR